MRVARQIFTGRPQIYFFKSIFRWYSLFFFSFLFLFCILVFFLLVCLFFEIKIFIFWYTFDYAEGWVIKTFLPGRFPKTGLIFIGPMFDNFGFGKSISWMTVMKISPNNVGKKTDEIIVLMKLYLRHSQCKYLVLSSFWQNTYEWLPPTLRKKPWSKRSLHLPPFLWFSQISPPLVIALYKHASSRIHNIALHNKCNQKYLVTCFWTDRDEVLKNRTLCEYWMTGNSVNPFL